VPSTFEAVAVLALVLLPGALYTRSFELLARVRTHAVPRGITTMFGSAIALTDGLIHHQDIRRALGHPRTVPQERLVAALNFAPRAGPAGPGECPGPPAARDRRQLDPRNRP
jgi:hypothetical protein